MFKPDYGEVITVKAYHAGEEVSSKDAYQVSQYSTRETMLKDIIDSLQVITSGQTHKLELCIKLDNKGRYRIVRKWGVE